MRPYEPTGMTTAKWAVVAPQRVRIDELVWGQDGVGLDGLRHHAAGGASWCGDEYPHVVVFEGRKYLSDGHHRVAVAICRGRKTVKARVLQLPTSED